MKNQFFKSFSNIVELKITGKNFERFLHRLYHSDIEILKISYPKHSEMVIQIYQKDYSKVLSMKTIYEVQVVKEYGVQKLKKMGKNNRVFFLFLLFGISFLFFLSHIIFDIEVVHTDKEIRTFLLRELESYGITKYSFKKSFLELSEIKEDILKRHKDKIEWLEIERVGTKYYVRVEERKIESEVLPPKPRHIVAKKSAILKKIDARSGQILHFTNEYVNALDIVISGEMKLNEEVKNITSAEGTIYGEVWYQTTVEYPFVYEEHYKTGNSKTVYAFQFLNFHLSLFDFHPFSKKEVTKKVLWKDFFLPFSFQKEKQEEFRSIEAIYTEEEAISKALELGRKRMEEKLKEGEKILDQKNLKVEVKESKIVVDMFFTVMEDITSYQTIPTEQE